MTQKIVRELKFGLNCGIEVNRPWDCLHRHDEIELTFFRTLKPVVYRLGGKIFEIRESDTLLFWGAIPHQLVDIEPRVEQYWLTIPPEIFLRWRLPDALTREVLNGGVLTECDEELRSIDVASFPLWVKEAARAGGDDRTPLFLSLEARLRRFGGFPRGLRGLHFERVVKESSSFLTIYEYIARHFKSDLRVEDIARAAGLHPNYAISLFRRESGTNIVDYITMLRVYEAQRLLLTSDLKVIDIAMEAGFGSMSNFYKSFKKICRKNPKDYRSGVGAA